MYIKKIFLVLFVFLNISIQAQVVDQNFPSDKEKIKFKDASDFVERKQYNSLMFDYSFQYTILPANDFFNSTNFQTTKFKYGNAYTFRALIYPILIDASTFASYYDTHSDFFGSNVLRHRGGEFTASYVLPTYNILPKKLYPYIGGGYQFSSIAFEYDRFPSQSMLYKAGLLYNIGQDVYLNFEYSQSSSFRNKYPYQHFTLSLGIRGESLYTTLYIIGGILFYVFLEAW